MLFAVRCLNITIYVVVVYMDCHLCSKHGIEIIMKIQKNFKYFFLACFNTLAIFILTQLGKKPFKRKTQLCREVFCVTLCLGCKYKVIEPLTGVKLQTLSS